MKLKEHIENHWLIIIIYIFGTGLCIGWFTANEILVKPRDFELTALREKQFQAAKGIELKEINKVIPASTAKEENIAKVSLGEATIKITNGIPIKNYENILKKEREQKGLRQLTAMESGKSIVEIAKGAYFFAFCSRLTTDWNNNLDLSGVIVTRFNDIPSTNFEIQKLQDGTVEIIGFLTEEAAVSISKLYGSSLKEIVLSPMPWGSTNTMVSIPIDRICYSKTRDIETGENKGISVLDIKLR